MDKTDYLEWLREWNACEEGLDWVESRPEDSAKDILLACDRVDWLVWNVGRMNPTKIAEFARRCADRAAAEAEAEADAAAAERADAARGAAKWAKRAAEAAERADAATAAWAAEWAAEAAAWAAWATSAELQAQLEDLHQLVKGGVLMEWRPVPGHPGYEVSSQGDVRYDGKPVRVSRKHAGRRLRYFTARKMNLTDGKMATGSRPQVFVATAVLEAFTGKPDHVCDTWHINGDSGDDRLENLIWIARGEIKKRRKAAAK